MKTWLMFVSVCVAGSLFGAEPALELRGVMVGIGPTKLSLRDKAADNTRWVEIGQNFVGYEVKAYDTDTETATLTKDGKELRLRINTAKAIDASPIPVASKATNETVRAIFNNLRQIASAADQYYLEHGTNSTTLNELVGPTKYIRQLQPVAGEDYSALKLSLAENKLTVTTPTGDAVTFDPEGGSSSIYTVQAGDTLARIAQKTGSSLTQLATLNGISDPTALKVGQPLRTK